MAVILLVSECFLFIFGKSPFKKLFEFIVNGVEGLFFFFKKTGTWHKPHMVKYQNEPGKWRLFDLIPCLLYLKAISLERNAWKSKGRMGSDIIYQLQNPLQCFLLSKTILNLSSLAIPHTSLLLHLCHFFSIALSDLKGSLIGMETA